MTVAQTRLALYFDEIVEPKELGREDLRALLEKIGSFVAVADSLGVSESFVRQTIQEKKYDKNRKRPLAWGR